jgi:NAD(P)-dependent dehydrogenase (short-subunit alcohol dehydrogenase family)
MGSLDGRVAVITGAARGLGREHALLLAAEGARVVVNDVDLDEADATTADVRAAGGEAIANGDDCTDWGGGGRLVQAAIDAYGRLDVLVNNAGFLRDRAIVNMTEDEWDDIVRVHLRGHFVPTRHAAAYWREQHKAGNPVAASVVHTSSTSGLFGNPGQSNYGAAKAGIAAFSAICAQELTRYGVRSNCIVPAARTRLTEATPGLADVVAPPDDSRFDIWHPANVSPIVAYLATADCPFNGATLFVHGGEVRILEPWSLADGVEQEDRWTVADLASKLGPLAARTPTS